MELNLTNFENGANGTFQINKYNSCRPHHNVLPYMFSKSQWVPHLGAGLAYVLIVQNIIIIRIFLKKDILSPVSILLSLLALSDTLSVLSWFVPEHIGYLLNYFRGSAFESYSIVTSSFEQYPFCVIAYWSRNILSSGFHTSAIIITTALGIQKTMVLLFPVFSKSHLNNKWAIVTSVVILVISIGLELPYSLFFSFRGNTENSCCKVLKLESATVKKFVDFSHHLRSGILIISILIQLVTTLYITSKLTCCRKTLWTDSKTVRRRNRRSTVIVIYITVIFILSEFPSVLVSIFLELRVSKLFSGYALQYLPLIISFGCFFNFWLYLVMSNRFRKELNIVRSKRRSRTRSSFAIV